MSIGQMFQKQELDEIMNLFFSFKTETISHDQVYFLLEKMGIEVAQGALEEIMSKISDPVPQLVDIELFARTIALILEENNRLPDEALDQLENIEESVNED